MKTERITMFHGRDCPHCRRMHPIVDQLISEGAEIDKKEVWHDDKNADEMRSFSEVIRAQCDGDLGVPTFLDKSGKRAICGELEYSELKEWIMKK